MQRVLLLKHHSLISMVLCIMCVLHLGMNFANSHPMVSHNKRGNKFQSHKISSISISRFLQTVSKNLQRSKINNISVLSCFCYFNDGYESKNMVKSMKFSSKICLAFNPQFLPICPLPLVRHV